MNTFEKLKNITKEFEKKRNELVKQAVSENNIIGRCFRGENSICYVTDMYFNEDKTEIYVEISEIYRADMLCVYNCLYKDSTYELNEFLETYREEVSEEEVLVELDERYKKYRDNFIKNFK